MKKVIFLLLAATLFAVALILLFNRPEKPMPPPAEQSLTISNPAVSANILPTQVGGTPSASPTNSINALPSETQPQPITPIDAEQLARTVVEKKNVAVEFWGKVVDQNDNPLAGVTIQSDVRRWELGAGASAYAQHTESIITTGPDGLFHIGGLTGDDLTLKLEKEGYELEPNAKLGFGYKTAEQFTPQPETPVVFKMWQTNIHEQLIAGEKSFHIIPDGRPYVIDLAKGIIAESGSGDLRVWIKTPPQVASGEKYDWTCEMNVVEGGLLEETNASSSMYIAPEKEYQPTFRYQQQPAGRQRASTGTRRFYLSLHNGKEFGKISVELMAPYNDHVPGLVHVDYALNPSGSRILR